jgi:hypothetical protein
MQMVVVVFGYRSIQDLLLVGRCCDLTVRRWVRGGDVERKKGKFMNTLERFYIYDETKKNNKINDKNTVQQNIISGTMLQASTDRGHPTH